MARRTAAFWAQLSVDYIEGVEKDGKLHQPSTRELGKTYSVSARAIAKHAKAGGWVEKRAEHAKAAVQLKTRREIQKHIAERQASNIVYIKLAQILKNEFVKAFSPGQQQAENAPPKTPEMVRVWSKVVETAQRIERLSAGECTELIAKQTRSQEEIDAIVAQVARAGGDLTEDEQVAALNGLGQLPLAEMLRVMGMLPPKSKP